MLLSETLFAMLLCLGIWLLVRESTKPLSVTGLGLASLPLALATLVRPISYYLMPILGIGVFAFAWARGGRALGVAARLRGAFVALGAFVLAPMLLVGGWQIYKYVRTGQPYYSSIESVNLYYYRAAEVVAQLQHRSRDDVSREMRDSVSGLTNRPTAAELARQAVRILLHHPGQTVLMSTRGAASFLLEPGIVDLTTLVGTAADQGVCFHKELLFSVTRLRFPSVLWTSHRAFFLLTLWGCAYLVLLYSGLVALLVRGVPGVLRSPSIVLLGILLYLLVATAGPESESRLRVPVMPILCLLGAGGWASLFHLGLPPRRPPVAPNPPRAVTGPKDSHVPA
jgi:hypothetical protein